MFFYNSANILLFTKLRYRQLIFYFAHWITEFWKNKIKKIWYQPVNWYNRSFTWITTIIMLLQQWEQKICLLIQSLTILSCHFKALNYLYYSLIPSQHKIYRWQHCLYLLFRRWYCSIFVNMFNLLHFSRRVGGTRTQVADRTVPQWHLAICLLNKT